MTSLASPRSKGGCIWLLIDLCTHMVVGWATSSHPDTKLALAALEMAIARHRPAKGLIHHSDRGSMYSTRAYVHRLEELEMLQSMSRKGDCYDNAVAESWFAACKIELDTRKAFASRSAARAAVFTYIDGFYNHRRLHSRLGYRTPSEVDRSWRQKTTGAGGLRPPAFLQPTLAVVSSASP